MRKQNSSMAHLWIADPLKQGALERLFSTHPPIADRVARLREDGRLLLGRFRISGHEAAISRGRRAVP